jgi:hypothetical protein
MIGWNWIYPLLCRRAANGSAAPCEAGRPGTIPTPDALKVRKGETIDAVIDTGTVLVTKENAADFK